LKGIVNLEFNIWSNYICNDINGRGVCNDGYNGSKDIGQKNNFKIFAGKQEIIEVILDLNPNKPTLDIHVKDHPNENIVFDLKLVPANVFFHRFWCFAREWNLFKRCLLSHVAHVARGTRNV